MSIQYNHKTYITKQISIPGLGDRLIISTLQLKNDLLDWDFEPLDEEALSIQEEIFAFIDPADLSRLSGEALANYILNIYEP